LIEIINEFKRYKGRKVGISKYRIHPDYSSIRGFKNDICMLQLAEDLSGECLKDMIKPISLLEEPPTVGQF
jgi:hypothetical protein